jgi:hypothetical protein
MAWPEPIRAGAIAAAPAAGRVPMCLCARMAAAPDGGGAQAGVSGALPLLRAHQKPVRWVT